MNISAATNNSLEIVNVTDSSKVVLPSAEGIAFCTGFILSFVFIVVGNLLVIVLFAVNRRLRKRSLFLIINMAFADLGRLFKTPISANPGLNMLIHD